MQPFLSPRMLGMRLDPRTTIVLASRHGFSGVEVLVRDIAERGDDLKELGAMKDDRGLRGGTWPLPIDWRGDADRFRRDLSLLSDCARIARALGLDRTGTWVLPEILDPALMGSDRPVEAAFSWHLERLDAIAAILQDHGQRFGLEAIGVASSRSGRGLPFIDRVEALVPLLEALRYRGRDVGLIVDAFHLYAAREKVADAVTFGVGSIVSVHLSDLPEQQHPDPDLLRDDRRTLPHAGGTIPCAELLRSLGRAGYTGPVFAEPMAGAAIKHTPTNSTELDTMVRLAANALRSVWPPEAADERVEVNRL